MLLRWQVYLARTFRRRDPVFIPWHALASLPEADFATGADALCRRWIQARDPAHPVNPLIAVALAARPPKSLAEAARMYALLFRGAEAVSLRGDGLDDPARDRNVVAAACGVRRAPPGFSRTRRPPERAHEPGGRPGTLARSPLADKAEGAPRSGREVACDRPRRPGAGDGPGRRTASSRAARLRPGKSEQPGRGRPAPVPGRVDRSRTPSVRRRQRPARARPRDRRSGKSPDRARPCQPRLDAPLRESARRYARRLRPPLRPADPSRAARPPRHRVRQGRMVDQASPSSDHALSILTSKRATTVPTAGDSIRRTHFTGG